MMSSILDSKEYINLLLKIFMKKIDGCIKINFKKVRTNKDNASHVEKLYTKMNILKMRDDHKVKKT